MGVDAERDLGLVAGSLAAAAENAKRLNAAMDAAWPDGKFTFADGSIGPILSEIRFAPKDFYFAGELRTGHRTGLALVGTGGRGSPLGEANFDAADGRGAIGGLVTRFTRLDPENGSREAAEGFVGGAILRLRGNGTRIEHIVFNGRRLPGNINSGQVGVTNVENGGRTATGRFAVTTDGVHGFQPGAIVEVTGVTNLPAANGRWTVAASPAPTNRTFTVDDRSASDDAQRATDAIVSRPLCPAGLVVEGRTTNSSGKHRVVNCAFTGCETAIVFLNGYTDEANNFRFVEQFNHADESWFVDNRFFGCRRIVLSLCNQSYGHQFWGMYVVGASGVATQTVFDVELGGYWSVRHLCMAPQSDQTVLRVHEYRKNAARFDIQVYRDGGGAEGDQFRLFDYAGGKVEGGDPPKWSVRFTGTLNGQLPDPTAYVKLKSDDGTQRAASSDLWFDVWRLPTNVRFPKDHPLDGYVNEVSGPWMRLVPPAR
jgi:hypothetical protein